MLSPLDPLKTRFLAGLDRAEIHRLSPFLELISLDHGDVLDQANGKMTYVYFPITATISIDYLPEDGGTSEFTRIGNQGMLGGSLVMDSERWAGRAAVQAAGYAFRPGSAPLMEASCHKGVLLRRLLRYTQARLLQVSQLAACNSPHTIRQRLCREGATEAARWLQQRGAITRRRGHVTFHRRTALHKRVVGHDEAIVAVADAIRRSHNVARLLGAPPGYVGYDEGGYLIKALRRCQCGAILFEKIEKAHQDVLQVLDDGRMTEGQGRTVDFRNMVIVMNSHLGSHLVQSTTTADPVYGARPPERASPQAIENPLSRPILSDRFGVTDTIAVELEDGKLVFGTLVRADAAHAA